jgi:uncharacterized DUF497 family protein
LKIEWDSAKAERNRLKHRVLFEDAEEALKDLLALTGDDPAHSDIEDRQRTIGHDAKGRLLVVITVQRQSVIRIVSARKASRREVELYEAEIRRILEER